MFLVQKTNIFGKKYRLLQCVTEHEFSCILNDKPYNDKDFYQRDYL